jgi:hypothetical protein
MPRLSPEARSASLYRATIRPAPPAPKSFDAETSELWRQIIGSKPRDWWLPGNLRLLRRYVRLCQTVERWEAALETLQPGTREATRVLKEVVSCNASLSLLASKLRLSITAEIDRKSGRLTEAGARVFDDPLLGGVGVRKELEHL